MSSSNTALGGFHAMGLSQTTVAAIRRVGFARPTEIQKKVIPLAIQQRDVLGMARTGSGKTAAFLIPLVEKLKEHKTIVGCRSVILSPTRELAIQTRDMLKKFVEVTNLTYTLLIGGASIDQQFEGLAANPDVILGTPGRISHHIQENSKLLSRVEVLVIDEADQLFELGFAQQLLDILQKTPVDRQVLLFSATLPKQLLAFSHAGLRDPEFVRLDSQHSLSPLLKVGFVYVRQEFKLSALLKILETLHQVPGKRTILFCPTRHHVEFLQLMLKHLGYRAACVYGSMDQEARIREVDKFRDSLAEVLVVTDVAARGLDIPDLDHVLNYDFPSSAKLFIHRVGRTSRQDKEGLALSLVTSDDLPYCMDISVFCGLKIQVVNPEAPTPQKGALIGGLPKANAMQERIDKLMAQDPDLGSLQKSAMAGHKLYYKTRAPSSKSSARRAQELVESAGGLVALADSGHPFFGDLKPKTVQHANLLADLRNFRPSSSQKGGTAISNKNFSAMSWNKQNVYQPVKTAATSGFHLGAESLKTPPAEGHADFDEVQVPDMDEREEGMAMRDYEFSLVPDENDEIIKHKSVMRWDVKKKKYLPTLISADNKVVKQKSKFKNDAGVTVSGQESMRGLYKAWQRKSKMRIQEIGEQEDLSYQKVNNPDADIRSFSEKPDLAIKEPPRKPIVKWTGHIEDQYLTNKQKRLLKNRTKNMNTVVSHGDQPTEELSLAAIKKKKETKLRNKTMNNPEMRKAWSKDLKAKYNEKNRKKIENRGQATRSKQLIFRK